MVKSRGSHLLCVLENLLTFMSFQTQNEEEKPARVIIEGL